MVPVVYVISREQRKELNSFIPHKGFSLCGKENQKSKLTAAGCAINNKGAGENGGIKFNFEIFGFEVCLKQGHNI